MSDPTANQPTAPTPEASDAVPPVPAPQQPAPDNGTDTGAGLSTPAAVPAAETGLVAPEGDSTPAVPAADPKLNRGDIVRHTWDGPEGEQEAYGLVLEVNTDNPDLTRASVLWFRARSGLMDASELEVLEAD